jgi:hypothetical protein
MIVARVPTASPIGIPRPDRLYGIPDILGRGRSIYAGKATLVTYGRRAAPISRAFSAAAMSTNYRRAANSAQMSEILSMVDT